jgi:hypothetical protein
MSSVTEKLVRYGFSSGQAQILEEMYPEQTGGVAGAIHSYYHFHGFAGQQSSDDDKFYDMVGLNHASRGANLSIVQLWATAGYASTVDPASGTENSVLRMPSLNFDYAGGEKLIVWWLGKATPEATNFTLIGDGVSTSLHGFQARVKTDGKLDLVLFGSTAGYSTYSTAAPFDGNLHSIAFAFDGARKEHCIWVDEAVSYGGNVGFSEFNSGTAHDTKTSNTLNIGHAHAAPGQTWESGVVKTRALAVLRLPADYDMPGATTLTSVFQQLRANPGRLISASAF